MAPTVHLVRHAQGYHNLCKENESLPDPSLTPFGEEQCQHLSTAFPYHSQVTKLVASPMRRAIHTCIQVFGQHQASGYRITAIDTLQELSDVPSDTGSRKEEILREFGDTVNLELVRETWTDKKSGSSPFEPTSEKIEARSLEARRTLRDIVDMESDEHVVVVTHGDYLHWLTNDWQINPWSICGWANCEYRSYVFADPAGLDDTASIIETDESRSRRLKNTEPLSSDEQNELRARWEKQFLICLKTK